MSIASKHAYRFGYLKSDQWSNVRLEALAREGGMCQICQEESISNDAHHVWYPENIYETTERHLVILCRPCHDFVHSMLPECKTKNEDDGISQWIKFRNALLTWRVEHMKLFSSTEGIKLVSVRDLSSELAKLKTVISSKASNGKHITKDELGKIFGTVRKLAEQGIYKTFNRSDLAVDRQAAQE